MIRNFLLHDVTVSGHEAGLGLAAGAAEAGTAGGQQPGAGGAAALAAARATHGHRSREFVHGNGQLRCAIATPAMPRDRVDVHR
jgi:hypothetical protein